MLRNNKQQMREHWRFQQEQQLNALTLREAQLKREINSLEAIVEHKLAIKSVGTKSDTRVRFASRPALDGGHLQVTPVRDYKFSEKTSFASRAVGMQSMPSFEEEEVDGDQEDDSPPEQAWTPNQLMPGSRPHQEDLMQGGRAMMLRLVLLAYYAANAPEDAYKVESLVARVVGGPPTTVEGGVVVGGVLWSEAELFAKLEAKYGVQVNLDILDLP